jgi:hypothetical protein
VKARGELALGTSPIAARRHIRRGEWVRTVHGIYVPASRGEVEPATTAAVLGASVLLAVDADAVSHDLAAAIHGFSLLERPVQSTATKHAERRRTPEMTPTCRLLRSQLWPQDVVTVAGVRVTSGARTLVDVARTMPFRAGVVLADSALRSGVTRAAVDDVLARCAGWPGIRRARAVVEFASPLSESALESVSRVAWHEEQLPVPQLQVTLGGDEAEGRPDMYWEGQHTIGEADGLGKYKRIETLYAEKDREDRLADLGLAIARWGWKHVQPRTQRVGAQRVWRAFERAKRLRA